MSQNLGYSNECRCIPLAPTYPPDLYMCQILVQTEKSNTYVLNGKVQTTTLLLTSAMAVASKQTNCRHRFRNRNKQLSRHITKILSSQCSISRVGFQRPTLTESHARGCRGGEALKQHKKQVCTCLMTRTHTIIAPCKKSMFRHTSSNSIHTTRHARRAA